MHAMNDTEPDGHFFPDAPSTQLEGGQSNKQADEQATGGIPNSVINPVLRGEHPPATSLADLRSRAKGKCDIRTRKHNNLTGDDMRFKEAKYDSYFTPGAMSDDETAYEYKDGGWVKLSSHFVSRAWEYYSKDVR
ncbi:hypothetical protein FRC08_007177 [Ceratobasidium sp. 394]|nr:hypothetical protein FRC08_007177 [Ceratobasidium sp. 394]